MEFLILGPLEAADSGGNVVPVGGAKPRALLARLLVDANHVVSLSAIADALWGDHPPKTAAATIQVYVSQIRKALESAEPGSGALIATHPPGYMLRSEAVDAIRFRSLIEKARAAEDLPAAGALLREALELFRGEPLTEFGHEFAQKARAEIATLKRVAVEQRIDADLDSGLAADVLPELETLVDQDPLNEGLRARLMHALYLMGRQSDALELYRRTRSLLDEELGVEPGPELQAMERAVLAQDASLSPAASPSAGNLPFPASSFVGRERERQAVAERLRVSRIVTLIGPGGVGKTRLSLEVAREIADRFPDGVWLTTLSAVTDPLAVPHALAGVLGVRDQPGRPIVETIAERLGKRTALILLDNCEHLLDAAASLAHRIVTTCPNVRCLNTSREPLGIDGEAVFPVEPIPTEDAIRLFAERAMAVAPAFDVAATNPAAVTSICSALEGFPLAIELTAARVATLPIETIAERLDLNFIASQRRIVEPRQRSLRATIEWSYLLLDDAERGLFRRLSVFPGTFGLDAAEAVACDKTAAERLAALVSKSLVLTEQSRAGLRYRMLDSLRQFAAEHRSENELADVRARIADHVALIARDTESGIHGPDHARWRSRLNEDLDTIRAALSYCAESNPGRGLSIVGDMWWFWGEWPYEGRRWLERLFQVARDFEPGYAKALAAAAALAWLQSDVEEAERLAAEAQRRAGAAGDRAVEALAMSWLGAAQRDRGDLDRARNTLERGLAIARDISDGWLIARGFLLALGAAEREAGDAGAAMRRFEECLDILGRIGDIGCIPDVQLNIGDVASVQGDLDLAERMFAGALETFQEVGDHEGESVAVLGLSGVRLAQGDAAGCANLVRSGLAVTVDLGRWFTVSLFCERLAASSVLAGDAQLCATLLGAAESLRAAKGILLTKPYQAQRETAEGAAKAGLGREDFERLVAEGRSMSPEQIVAVALGR